MTNKEETFGSRLTDLRKSKGLKQKDLAEILGKTTSAVGQYEANLNMPSLEGLIKLSEYFQISLDWLIKGLGEKPTSELPIKTHTEFITSFVDKQDNEYVPVYPWKVAANVMTGYHNTGELPETDDFISIPPHIARKPGIKIGITVQGESMGGTFLDGDKVAIRRIEKTEWQFLDEKMAMVIVANEETGVAARIKRLKKNRLTKLGKISVSSDNLDKRKYPDYDILLEDIIEIWIPEKKDGYKFPNVFGSVEDRISELDDKIDLLSDENKELNRRFEIVAGTSATVLEKGLTENQRLLNETYNVEDLLKKVEEMDSKFKAFTMAYKIKESTIEIQKEVIAELEKQLEELRGDQESSRAG